MLRAAMPSDFAGKCCHALGYLQPAGEVVTKYVCVPLEYGGPTTLTRTLPNAATTRHVFVTGCPVTRQFLDDRPPGAVPVPRNPHRI